MLKLSFQENKSKFYGKALRLASSFDGFCDIDGIEVPLSLKEIFEKWETFNLLFWTVVDWKSTVLEYDGMRYQSHTDKTRLFYAVQEAHKRLIASTANRLGHLDKLYTGELSVSEIGIDRMPEDEINFLIDSFVLLRKPILDGSKDS